jgi:hypothetical protein
VSAAAFDPTRYSDVVQVSDTEYRLPDPHGGDWYIRQHPHGTGWYAVCPDGGDGFPTTDDHDGWNPDDVDKQQLFPTAGDAIQAVIGPPRVTYANLGDRDPEVLHPDLFADPRAGLPVRRCTRRRWRARLRRLLLQHPPVPATRRHSGRRLSVRPCLDSADHNDQ